MENEIYLTDLIDVETLQKIQDSFAKMTGIGTITTDANGVAITQGSGFSDFCMKCTRNSFIGNLYCEQCDRYGANMALEKGRSVTYTCHAGLIDFAAPIIVNDQLIGSFIGGQVLTEPPDFNKFVHYAFEIGVDPEEYVNAVQKVRLVTEEEINNATDFLYVFANVLSNIAYNKYLVNKANVEIEKAAKMKSDFLANMSHEIRTPMNAVIGMSEMALREDLPPVAREYINQIKVAGKSLLAIINDILDFSKIESGKMDIIPVDYEPMSLINDIANIIMTRIGEKEIELILDISPDIPFKLFGDNIRIKQILLNLLNNATKFTTKGKIVLKMDYVVLSDDKVDLRASIEDTGIGIKKQDLKKLFQSFQQVDSKRNRNIEGTGLGLAISKQLLTIMGGNISVESEYGKGSKFFFNLPQKILDAYPSIIIREPNSIFAVGLISNPYVKEQLNTDVTKLGVEYKDIVSEEELDLFYENKKMFLFIENPLFSETVENFILTHPQIIAVLLTDYHSTAKYNASNLLIVKKPLFTLNIATIFNQEKVHTDENISNDVDFDFIAPNAEILIVDDNAINLTIAEGLLEPLKMKVDTALSGKEAIAMISVHHYDIIFMDHMMPELDGVETTHIIRRFHAEYNDVPIIALTANAVDGTKEMFKKEGMNDFVAKPIELRILVSKVKEWLPVEKIERVFQSQNNPQELEKKSDIVIGDLDVAYAIRLLGTENLFWKVLKDYYRVIDKKVKLIKSLEDQEDWVNYTIEVHALKSASKQIGAISLSEKAAAMEKAGNARDAKLIHKNTGEMLKQYFSYIPILEPFCVEEEENIEKKDITKESLLNYFFDIKTALDNLDMDVMDSIIQEMNQFAFSEPQERLFTQLKNAVDEFDVDTCISIIQDWEKET